MKKHTPGPCGCCEKKMQTGIGEFPDGIEFCPLHAAAPELLEALKVAREWMGSIVTGKRLDKAQTDVDAAIAKAEGSA